jgi:hypothetical protein
MTEESEPDYWEMDAEELLEATVASYKPGRFRHVMPALRRFCELSTELRDICIKLQDLPLLSDEASRLFERQNALVRETVDLGDVCMLWPGLEDDEPARPA